MARDHARISLSIWNDDKFRDLTPAAQHLYLVLLTSPHLSFCGVTDWRPSRLRTSAAAWPELAFDKAAEELARTLYIVVDEDTEEVLVRSFIRNDGLMKQPKMAVAMARAYGAVASKGIRSVVVHELNRLRESEPDLKSWSSQISGPLLSEIGSNAAAEPFTYPTGYPSVNPTVKGTVYPPGKGIEKDKRKGTGKGTGTPSPTPTPYSHSLKAVPDEPDTTEVVEAQAVTDRAYQRVGKAFNFIAVRGLVKWALAREDQSPQSVEDAVVAIYDMGKPITKQVLGQYLDGKLPGSARPMFDLRDPKSGLLVER